MFHHFFTEVTEKVDALVAGLVHARLELLAAKFTAATKVLQKCLSQLTFRYLRLQ
jgi:hypothetical protein